jgi:hypothetical protein
MTEIECYQEIIHNFEKALKESKGIEDIRYYQDHIAHFKKKIKELGGEV